jgi:hypothetical protein
MTHTHDWGEGSGGECRACEQERWEANRQRNEEALSHLRELQDKAVPPCGWERTSNNISRDPELPADVYIDSGDLLSHLYAAPPLLTSLLWGIIFWKAIWHRYAPRWPFALLIVWVFVGPVLVYAVVRLEYALLRRIGLV